MKFTYKWKLTDLEKVKKNGLKVFSCFACGGGSTMGYKMSGFDVIGCNEIDPEMIKIYKKNHNPKHVYLESIETFKLRDDLPKELYNLDILDGSPPCSSFSMAGSREKAWGKKKKFREGQKNQVLDDLFFHYIELVKKLQPKVVIAENVKGLIQGNAKGYVKQIIKLLNLAGYNTQLFLLNGATMGLPQRRERVFFMAYRKDLKYPKLKLKFNEESIILKDALKGCKRNGKLLTTWKSVKPYWEKAKIGDSLSKHHPKGSFFSFRKLNPNTVAPTFTAHWENNIHWSEFRTLSMEELSSISSFPSDYKFKSENSAGYQMGMSVPPIMMHKISQQIALQWFNKK